jgi:hypothetical protein
MGSLSYDDLKKQLDWYSASVSTAVRTTAFGVIAAIWAVFTADGISLNHNGLLGVPTSLSVKWAFVFAGGALMTDILQYVSAYWMTSIGFDRFEAAEEETNSVEFHYDSENLGIFGAFLYHVSFILFPCKLILAILSALAFLFLAFAVDVSSV